VLGNWRIALQELLEDNNLELSSYKCLELWKPGYKYPVFLNDPLKLQPSYNLSLEKSRTGL